MCVAWFWKARHQGAMRSIRQTQAHTDFQVHKSQSMELRL